MLTKIIIICACIAVGVFCFFYFLLPFLTDLSQGIDPAERYEPELTVEFETNHNDDSAYEGITVSDSYIYEIACSYSIKNDPFFDGDRIIFSTDGNVNDGVALNTVLLYDANTKEVTALPGVTKKYDNIIMTKLSGNYAVWIDCMKEGGGRICGYDIEKQKMFVIKEFGYAIPEISISGNYIAFMQVAGETTQRLYLYDLENRTNTTVKVYESKNVSCGNVSISGTDMVWSEYASDGTAVMRCLDFSDGIAEYKEYEFGDWVFEPKTNGEYIMFTNKKNSLDADLMLSSGGEAPVKIASGVLDYAIGDNFAVYSIDEKIYVVALDKALQSEAISGDVIRAKFASLNHDNLCFYDVTDGFGLIDSVRYVTIAKEEE